MTLDATPDGLQPETFSVRLLGPNDVHIMGQMLTTFGEAFEDVETYGARRPSSEYLARLLGSDTFVALAALKGDAVVGRVAAGRSWRYYLPYASTYVRYWRCIDAYGLLEAPGVCQEHPGELETGCDGEQRNIGRLLHTARRRVPEQFMGTD